MSTGGVQRPLPFLTGCFLHLKQLFLSWCVIHIFYLSSHGAETGGGWVWDQSRLYNKFEANLGYTVTACLKKRRKRKKPLKLYILTSFAFCFFNGDGFPGRRWERMMDGYLVTVRQEQEILGCYCIGGRLQIRIAYCTFHKPKRFWKFRHKEMISAGRRCAQHDIGVTQYAQVSVQDTMPCSYKQPFYELLFLKLKKESLPGLVP